MTKFEEEVKRPDNTGIDPFSKRDVDFSKLAEKFIRGAQTLKNWRNYADYKEHQLEEKDEYILKLENENSFLRDLHTTFDSNGNSVEPIIPQQALPVVPECVAEWIDKNISVAHNAELIIHNILICAIDNKNRYLFPLEVEKFVLKNPITFLNAVITGKYEVEKPQLFYLKHIDMSKADKECDWYLITDCVKLCHEWVRKNLKPKDDDFKFTQAEIDSMQTGSYEQIEVEK